jgi:uncharacterized oxidoreductase
MSAQAAVSSVVLTTPGAIALTETMRPSTPLASDGKAPEQIASFAARPPRKQPGETSDIAGAIGRCAAAMVPGSTGRPCSSTAAWFDAHTWKTEHRTMKLTGNTILITGGGSGIGRELALRFNDLGNTVIIGGRRRQALEETIAGRERMHAMVLDIEDSDALTAFAERVIAAHPALNVLINNAGIMRREDLTRPRNLRDAEETIITNLLGPIRLTNALIDHLARQPSAAIVNVSSGLAFVPLSGTPTYSATKAAIHSYTVSLREQLKGKVEVIELAPPAVQTELTSGQSTREGYMPLGQFSDEVMTILRRQPTPKEVLVERVGFLRWAERDGAFDRAVEMLSAH